MRRKWLHIIINDDFLENGECYDRALLPSIICLGRLRIASIQSLTTTSGSRLFGSVVRASDFYPGGPGSIPTSVVEIFSAMLHSFVTTFMS